MFLARIHINKMLRLKFTWQLSNEYFVMFKVLWELD
jgi:hypothetical protein